MACYVLLLLLCTTSSPCERRAPSSWGWLRRLRPPGSHRPRPRNGHRVAGAHTLQLSCCIRATPSFNLQTALAGSTSAHTVGNRVAGRGRCWGSVRARRSWRETQANRRKGEEMQQWPLPPSPHVLPCQPAVPANHLTLLEYQFHRLYLRHRLSLPLDSNSHCLSPGGIPAHASRCATLIGLHTCVGGRSMPK